MPHCTINGEAYAFDDPPTVAALLEDMALTGRKIAVERNGCIIPKSRHDKEVVANGDTLEIVTAVGGG